MSTLQALKGDKQTSTVGVIKPLVRNMPILWNNLSTPGTMVGCSARMIFQTLTMTTHKI